MLNVLPESRRVRRRATASAVMSAAVHVGIIAAAIFTSATARPLPPPVVPDTILRFQPPQPERSRDPIPPSPGPTVPRRDNLPPAPDMPRIPPVDPTTILVGIPPVDVQLGPMFAPESARVSVIASRAAETAGGVDADPAMRNEYADKPALARADNPPPRYPEMLRAAGVRGSVTMRFVIDSLGRVAMRTVEVRHSDHELFTAAVLAVLPRIRFVPAEANGRRVRVLAEQRFEFRLMP